MRKILCSAALALLSLSAFSARLDIRPAEDRIYKIGETVTFTATAFDDKNQKLTSGSYDLHVTESGGRTLVKPFKVNVAENNPCTFTVKLDKPGFLMVLSKKYTPEGGKAEKWKNKGDKPAFGGAAVEPGKIVPGAAKPADFDEFWQRGIEEFKKAEVIVEPADKIKIKGYKVSRITVKFPDGSGFCDGFFAVPLKKGKYPIVAGVPGAGPGSLGPMPPFRPSQPAIMLIMNVHPFRTADTVKEQKALYAKYQKSFKNGQSYPRATAFDREKYVFRNAWLAASRAIDYLAGLPEYDGKNCASVGSSQGGGTAFALGYLNKNVTCTVANVPALCDHGGWKLGRMSGWPCLHESLSGKADKVSPYFDGAHFASGIKHPTLVSAGFVDMVCVPSSVYAAYNQLQGAKEMFHMYRQGHTVTTDFRKKATEFLDKQLSKK